MNIISLLFIIWLLRFVRKPSESSLIFALFLFPPAIIVLAWPIEFGVKRWIALSMFLLLIYKHGAKLFRSFPLRWIIIVMFLESCILILPDDRFDILHRLLYPFMDALDIYFPLFLGFALVFITRIKIERLMLPLSVCCIVVEIYAIFNLLTGLNPVEDIINNIYSLEAVGYTGNEFRAIVKSVYRYSFDFGFNSTIFILFFIYYYLTQRNSFKLVHWLAAGLAMLGVFLCGSRTVIVSTAISVFVCVLFMKSIKTKTIIVTAGCVILGSLYMFVPSVTNIVDITLQTLAGNSDVSGSSVDMRSDQLDGALAFMLKNPIFGNGFKYIFIDLDWKNHASVDGMAGYESLVFSLLIERGILGIVSYFLFFCSIIVYFLMNKKKNTSEALLGLSLIILFLVFAIFTGALDAWLNTMIICGLLMGTIEKSKRLLILK